MAKLEISKVEIIASLVDAHELVDMLQRSGTLEIAQTQAEGLDFSDTSAAITRFDKYLASASGALDAFSRYAPRKKALMSMLSERRVISLAEYLKGCDEADEILSLCYDVNAAVKAIGEDKLEIIRCKTAYDLVEPWIGSDIPTSYTGVGALKIYVGSFPRQYDSQSLLEELAAIAPQAEAVDAQVVSSGKSVTRAVVVCHRTCSDEIEQALRELGFVKVQDPTKHPPAVRAKRLQDRIAELEADIEERTQHIVDLAPERERVEFLYDYMLVRRDKYEALSSLGMTQNVLVITGWAATKKAVKLKEKIESDFIAEVTLSVPGEDEDVPVELENKAFFRPLESLVSMFATPSKNDIDPTAITAVFYYIFFGAMLSDAGYGLIMVIALTIVLNKFKLEPKMHDTVVMYRWCGVSTVVWGALYGSWFGDIINVVRTNFMGLPAVRTYLWIDPLNDLLRLMVWCFGFGLVHLFAGVVIKAYMCWRDGDKFGAFSELIPPLVLVLGAAPIFVNLFIDVPQTLKSAAPFVVAVGAVLVVATAGRASPSIGGKIGSGLYGLYNMLSGYLGDVLSYSRLLALGLATGVIASVVNLLGTIPQSMTLKAIVLPIAFVVGHIANLGINLIGAYVHTTRLQYVEFYSKFYEGGGRSIKPLGVNTQFIKFKEENTHA